MLTTYADTTAITQHEKDSAHSQAPAYFIYFFFLLCFMFFFFFLLCHIS